MNSDKIKKRFVTELVESLYTDERIKKYGESKVINQIVKKWEKYRVKNIPDSFLSRPIYEDEINVLKNLEKQFWIGHTKDIGLIAKQNIIFACLGSVSEWDMIKRIRDSTKELSKSQIVTLVNTQLRTFSRAVFVESVCDLPENTTFTYVGPQDERNSDSCASVLGNPQNAEGFTRAEIMELPVGFIDGGGLDCRHSWEMVI